MHKTARRRFVAGGLDGTPQSLQKAQIVAQGLFRGALASRAHNHAQLGGHFRNQRRHHGAQPLALGVVLDACRDTDMLIVGQQHQVARRNGGQCGQTGTLAAQRILEHLDENALAFVQQAGNQRQRAIGRLIQAHHVGGVQEARAFQTNIHEGGLHAGQHALHLAHVEIADQAVAQGALDVGLLHDAALHQRDAGFLRRNIDQDLGTHAAATC